MSAPRPRRLYHYCCDHSVEGILASGELRPNPHQNHQERLWLATGVNVIVLPVVWLTDIEVASVADADLIGLSGAGGVVTCDRLAYRFRVPNVGVEWWPEWADRAVADGRLTAKYRTMLELERAPQRWWVATEAVRGPQLDTRYVRPTPVA